MDNLGALLLKAVASRVYNQKRDSLREHLDYMFLKSERMNQPDGGMDGEMQDAVIYTESSDAIAKPQLQSEVVSRNLQQGGLQGITHNSASISKSLFHPNLQQYDNSVTTKSVRIGPLLTPTKRQSNSLKLRRESYFDDVKSLGKRQPEVGYFPTNDSTRASLASGVSYCVTESRNQFSKMMKCVVGRLIQGRLLEVKHVRQLSEPEINMVCDLVKRLLGITVEGDPTNLVSQVNSNKCKVANSPRREERIKLVYRHCIKHLLKEAANPISRVRSRQSMQLRRRVINEFCTKYFQDVTLNSKSAKEPLLTLYRKCVRPSSYTPLMLSKLSPILKSALKALMPRFLKEIYGPQRDTLLTKYLVWKSSNIILGAKNKQNLKDCSKAPSWNSYKTTIENAHQGIPIPCMLQEKKVPCFTLSNRLEYDLEEKTSYCGTANNDPTTYHQHPDVDKTFKAVDQRVMNDKRDSRTIHSQTLRGVWTDSEVLKAVRVFTKLISA